LNFNDFEWRMILRQNLFTRDIASKSLMEKYSIILSSIFSSISLCSGNALFPFSSISFFSFLFLCRSSMIDWYSLEMKLNSLNSSFSPSPFILNCRNSFLSCSVALFAIYIISYIIHLRIEAYFHPLSNPTPNIQK